jgi:hypothetical protein
VGVDAASKESHQGLVALGEQGRITLAEQFGDKRGAGLLYDFCGRSHSCKGLEYPRGRGSAYAQLPPLFVSSEG